MKPIRRRHLVLLSLWMLCHASLCCAQATPSVQDTMDAIVTRMYATLDASALARLDDAAVQAFITPEERQILATKYWCFDANEPVIVSIMRDAAQPVVPFWLIENGFQKTDGIVRNEEYEYEVWQKSFDAGRIELGINGFDKHRPHYFVCVRPQNPGGKLELRNFFPVRQHISEMRKGALTYHDWTELVITELPQDLEGQMLLTTIRGRAREAHLIDAFRNTPFPSSERPDHVALTWSEDPATTQSVQWRTNTSVKDGVVRYREKQASNAPFLEMKAVCGPMEDRLLTNDRYIHRFAAVLRGLKPGTTYVYNVGSPTTNIWNESAEFTTAPDTTAPFSFLFTGDTHRSPDWGKMLAEAFSRHPQAAFCMIGGDLVSTGLYRDDWDQFFEYSKDVFKRIPAAPCIGNHDDQDGLGASMYLAIFDLPKNGPAQLEPERAYGFRYGNALFVVLDSCSEFSDQTAWLEDQLSNTNAVWKFAMFHFPPYAPTDDYPEIRREWGRLFDQYHVDFVLNGHVHHYLRTKPMRGGAAAASPADGTIYIVSVAVRGDSYDEPAPECVEKLIGGTALYHAFDIDGSRLTFRAYDATGALLDELIVQK